MEEQLRQKFTEKEDCVLGAHLKGRSQERPRPTEGKTAVTLSTNAYCCIHKIVNNPESLKKRIEHLKLHQLRPHKEVGDYISAGTIRVMNGTLEGKSERDRASSKGKDHRMQFCDIIPIKDDIAIGFIVSYPQMNPKVSYEHNVFLEKTISSLHNSE